MSIAARSLAWRELLGPSASPATLVVTRIGWPLASGVLWFVLAFAGMLWLWSGPNPVIFNSPDEATTRYASQLVSNSGRPEVAVDITDVEDVLHPRAWVTMDHRAIPVLPPATYYVHAGLRFVPVVGPYLVLALSAAGIGAFAAAVSLLGQRRQWLGLLAPAAAFPALYWLMRPWMNMSLMLALVSFALLLWVLWLRSHSRGWLVASAGMLMLAVTVRPDYAAGVLLTALLLTLAHAKSDERWFAATALVGAGVGAVALSLLLNQLTTGDAFTFGYEIYDARHPDPTQVRHDGLPTPLSELYFLLLPSGLPSAVDVGKQLGKYWLLMGPIAALTLGTLLALPAMLCGAGARAWFYVAAIAWVLLFVVSRVDYRLFGASLGDAHIHHSLPRYWSPVYLLAVVPVALLAMRASQTLASNVATILIVGLAVSGAHHIYAGGGPESMTNLRTRLAWSEYRFEDLQDVVPADAVVYSSFLDKTLWSGWDIGMIPRIPGRDSALFDLERGANSIENAQAAGRDVYVLRKSQLNAQQFHTLEGLLADRGLTLAPVEARLETVYRVDEAPQDNR